MKSTNLKIVNDTRNCLSFRQLSLFTLLSLVALDLKAADAVSRVDRKPAAIEEEILTVPLEKDANTESLFAEDDAGIMKGMKSSLEGWEKTEEFAKNWDLESTGLYNTPTTSQKRKFIAAKMLKYADKRLAGEMKKADEGSTLHKIGRVEKQLRPSASVPVSKFISLKFKARVLQGKAIMEVKNPWIECNATVSANGKTKIISKKDFQSLGLTTGAEYTVNNAEWIAYADQQVTNNIKARLSSTQERGEGMFSNAADAKVEMTASFPFNL